MFLIAYTSEYVGGSVCQRQDVDDILAAAKRNNLQFCVTGVMFFHQNRFLQFLEGEESAVRSVLSRIEVDPRHTNIHYLLEESVEKRGFAEWSMECFQLPESESLELDYLLEIRDAYKKNFAVHSKTLVEMYRSFVEDD